MPSPIQASIAAGQQQARQLEPQTNQPNTDSARGEAASAPQARDRGPAATLDVAPEPARVTGGEIPAASGDGAGVQGTATDNGADRLAAGRDLNAPQTDAGTLARELGALGATDQAGPADRSTAAQGPSGAAVLGAFASTGDEPAAAGDGTGSRGDRVASTAPGTGGADGALGVAPEDLTVRPEPGDIVRG